MKPSHPEQTRTRRALGRGLSLSLAFALVGFVSTIAPVAAQIYDPLPGPSPYGPEDEAGASNTQTVERVKEAVKLVKTGKVYRLGHVYEKAMPAFPGDEGWHLEPKPVQTVGQPGAARQQTAQGRRISIRSALPTAIR